MFSLFRSKREVEAEGWVLCWESASVTRGSGRQFLSTHPQSDRLRKTPHLSMAVMFSNERAAKKAATSLEDKGHGTLVTRRVKLSLEV